MLWDFCCAWSAACQLLGYLGSQAAELRLVEAMSTATKARLDSIPNNSEVHLADQTTLQVLLSHPEPGAHLGDIEDQLTRLQTTCTRGRSDNASTQSNHHLKNGSITGGGSRLQTLWEQDTATVREVVDMLSVTQPKAYPQRAIISSKAIDH